MPLADPVDVLAACRAAAADAERSFDAESAAQWWSACLLAHDALPGRDRSPDARDDLLVARVEALVRAGQAQTVLDTVHAELLEALREGRTTSVGRLAAALLRTAGAWPWVSSGADPGPLLARLAGIEHLRARRPAGARAGARGARRRQLLRPRRRRARPAQRAGRWSSRRAPGTPTSSPTRFWAARSRSSPSRTAPRR